MAVPILVKLLVHRDTCDPKGNINPNPRATSVEYLLRGCVVQWIAVQLTSSTRWSRTRGLVHHEESKE